MCSSDLLECEAAAFATDSRISNADGTSVNSDVGCTVYGNSHGLIAGHAGSRHSIGCVMIAEADGQMQRDYWYDYGRRADQLTAAATIGRIAAERTVSRLGARSHGQIGHAYFVRIRKTQGETQQTVAVRCVLVRFHNFVQLAAYIAAGQSNAAQQRRSQFNL